MNNFLYSLACLSFCTVIGGAVYEHIAAVPHWAAAPPVSLSMFQGKYGLNPEPFWMFVHPVTIVLIGVSIILNQKNKRRNNLLFVFGCYIAVLAITATYFVPELLAIIKTPFATVADLELTDRAKMWELLSLLRLALLHVMAVSMLMGLAKGEAKREVGKKNEPDFPLEVSLNS